ncbi:hypothetical protein VDGL01_09582 [Verticillium dahliae]
MRRASYPTSPHAMSFGMCMVPLATSRMPTTRREERASSPFPPAHLVVPDVVLTHGSTHHVLRSWTRIPREEPSHPSSSPARQPPESVTRSSPQRRL